MPKTKVKQPNKTKQIQKELSALESKYENQIHQVLFEANQLVTERPDGDGWTLLTDKHVKGILATDHRSMIQEARNQYRLNAHAHGAVETMVHYIMGQGILITPRSDNLIIRYFWREFWTSKRNGMELRQFEIVRRVLRDGELFNEYFEDLETGKTTLRFIDPPDVKEPKTKNLAVVKNRSHGIEFDENDIEKKIKYWVTPKTGGDAREVPAENVHHIKAFADSDQLRGDSWLLPAMRMFTLYKQWLDARVMLNKIRASIALIKTITGGQSDIERIRATLGTASPQRGGETKKESFRPGSTITANKGVKYEFLSPNLQASDVKEDGRAMKLDMASALNLPEYALGDSSNSNYASTLVAEAPFVKAVQYWQKFFEYWFGMIGRKVIENVVKAGILDEPNDEEFLNRIRGIAKLSEDDHDKREEELKKIAPNGKLIPPSETFYGFDIQWPQIIHREFKAFTEALVAARTAGWISDDTAAGSLGFEYQEEVRKQNRIDKEAEKEENSLAGKGPKDAEGEQGELDFQNEMANILKDMTPEEKEQIMKSNNPADIAKLLLSKISGNANGKKQTASKGEQ